MSWQRRPLYLDAKLKVDSRPLTNRSKLVCQTLPLSVPNPRVDKRQTLPLQSQFPFPYGRDLFALLTLHAGPFLCHQSSHLQTGNTLSQYGITSP